MAAKGLSHFKECTISHQFLNAYQNVPKCPKGADRLFGAEIIAIHEGITRVG